MAVSLDHLEEAPEVARAGSSGAQRQLAAGECILTHVKVEKNKLQDANTELGMELKDMRAQLADFVKESRRLRGGIFSMCRDLPLHSSARKETDNNYVCRYINGPS